MRGWGLRLVGAGILLVVLVAAVILATQHSDTLALNQPRDFAAIQSGAIAIASDPSGRSATLHVRTTIKTVCAVAYGRTTAFGHLSTTPSMDPTGTYVHAPVLGGLLPATTYVYRLQGIGPDGGLYQSAVFSFRTPRALALGRDEAIGATILAVSSEYAPQYAGRYAVDGDPSTEWATNGDGNHAFITIDLHRALQVTAIAFRTRSMSDGSAITRTFSVTVDGKQTYGPFPASLTGAVTHVSFHGRVLRFAVVSSTGGNTGASEIAVYSGS